MTAHENSHSRRGGEESPFSPCCLVKKWSVADPKMIFFAKNQELYFLALKCKTTPILAKSAGTCTKFKKYLRRLLQQNESFYAYSRMSTIYLGCFPSFWFRVSVAASPKKNLLRHPENGKKHFSWDETKIGLPGIPLYPKGNARVWYGLVSTNYAMLMAESSSFNLKVMQPRTW
jgi:hypothetical protein